MILGVYLLFFVACLIAYVVRPTQKTVTVLLIAIGIVLFLLAGFRDGNVEHGLPEGDYEAYISYFRDFNNVNVEPTFKWISASIHAVNGEYLHLFLVYAFLGVTFKLLAIKKLSDLIFYSVVVYVSHLFILHEMVQIRVSVAAGLIMLSFIPLYERKLVRFVLILMCAGLFHISALMALPLYFLNTKSINSLLYGSLLPIAYVFNFCKINIISLLSVIPVPYIQRKIFSYQTAMESGISFASDINIFNSVHLIQCVIAYLLLTKIETIAPHNRYAYMLLKIYILGLFIFAFFAGFPVLAGRGKELFLVTEIIVIPWLVYLFKPPYIGKVIVMLYALGVLSITVFHGKLIPY